jgi:putative transposase
MGRPLRIEYEGALYHVTSRGNEQRRIFTDRTDCEKLLYYLGKVHDRYGIMLHAYALMKNHYHLLIETPRAQLFRTMRDLNGHYTVYFNTRHDRKGHLFQGRCRAILVERESYLLELSRYIHLNPVRVGAADTPDRYPYSSMACYLGKAKSPAWLNTGWTLGRFGTRDTDRRKAYRAFVLDGITQQRNPLDDVRKMFVYLARRYSDAPLASIIEYLGGNIADSAISWLYRNAERELKERKHFRTRLGEIERRLLDSLPDGISISSRGSYGGRS